MDSSELRAQALALLNQPGIRAVMLVRGDGGSLELHPVARGKSVLDLRTELLDHLNAQPLEDEFIAELRDWAEGREAARAEARRTGGFVIPRARGQWQIAHVPAFAPVAVGAA